MTSAAQQAIEARHAGLESLVESYFGPVSLTVSIASINDRAGGQMIMAHPRHSKREIAQRLRLCADILESDPRAK